MTAAPKLSLILAGIPPYILITRSIDVPTDLWRALDRNIAPGRTRIIDGNLAVPIESFLARRNWLAQNLATYECEVSFDQPVLNLLERELAEFEEITATLDARNRVSLLRETHETGQSRFLYRRLKRFQRRDLAKIMSLSHGANFSVPGSGKTAVAYACYEAERVRARVERMLVVAPLSAFDSWVGEAKRWMNPTPRVEWLEESIPRNCEVLLVNYQRLVTRFDDVAAWVMSRPCHVILDEAHRIKRGKNGEWGAACLDLSFLAARRDILTGTPAPQHPTDFVALVEFLWPHQGSRLIPAVAGQPNPPPDVMARISARLEPLFARTKKDELGLDPPVIRVELVQMKPLQREIYNAMRSSLRQRIGMSVRDRAQFSKLTDIVMFLIEGATNPALLASALGRPDQATSVWPPSPIPPTSSLIERVMNYPNYEMPAKFDKLATMVAANAQVGRKTLVWSNFVGNLEDLTQNVLSPYHPALIYGAIPSSPRETNFITRQTELNRFRNDNNCMVLLANPAAMSEGVSLHKECHDAIYLDRTFNAGQYLQSLDRIHRLGLKKGTETRITFLLASNSIDEAIDRRIRVKANRLSEMLKDPNLTVMALPDPDDYGEWIEPTDVDILFSHLEQST